MGRCKVVGIRFCRVKSCCHECAEDCTNIKGCEPDLPLDASINSNRWYKDCRFYEEGEDE